MPFTLNKKKAINNSLNLKIPINKFIFLISFDYLSYKKRKNPDAAIIAFAEEFKHNQNVILIIKTLNMPSKLNFHEKLAIEKSDNIIYLDDCLSTDEMHELLKIVNCYVSLHRSEGLGLVLAEAMSIGTLTIATGYSGNMEFMSHSNSLLVDYELIPVKLNDYPYACDNFWADPIILDARKKFRLAFTDQENSQKLIAKAKLDMSKYNYQRQINWINSRFNEILYKN
jgi:glycosyltransferase involved in cell wall biosynthesis